MRAGPTSVDPTSEQKRVAALLEQAGSAVVLTGAGVSVPSGIPDFRSPGTGLWAHVDPMAVAHIDVWRRDPEYFWSFYGQRFHVLGPAEPSGGHRVVAELQPRGLIGPVITQNIDRLHHKGGATDVIEMHGSIAHGECLACGATVEFELLTTRIAAASDGVPRCDCGAPLKPGVVLFGEMLPEEATDRAFELCADADLMVAIGSSLEVHPVAALPAVVLRGGGDLVLVTQGETPYDDVATVKLTGDVAEELQGVLAAL
ncbi:MAG: NAD-dependent protein deacylase [Solirubrobacteraceae bacterium]|nr:NAD-dependent protein deacylase [Solirubrobacteraceae bacterium]